MNDEDKQELLDEFIKSDGAKRLDLWDYALAQQVLWDQIITQLTIIAKKQNVDKKLEKMVEEELAKLEKQ
jgi:hypothetical protein